VASLAPTPSVLGDAGVQFVIGVIFGASIFECVGCGDPLTPTKVFLSSDRLQVFGVHAVAYSTFVIQVKSFGDGTYMDLVAKSVCQERGNSLAVN
jgi:hypothetical protein